MSRRVKNLVSSLRVGSSPRPESRAHPPVFVEVRIWFPGRDAVRIRGYLDTLDMNNDYEDATTSFSMFRQWRVTDRHFTLKGRVRPWRKRDRPV